MIHTDDRFSSEVADAVAAIEQRTDAELVVVAASRSARYASVPAASALAVALISATVMLFAPWWVSPTSFFVEMTIGAVLTAWITSRPMALRRLVPQRIQAEAVRLAAHDAFVDEAVHGTPNRSGVLVYISALEGRVVVVADLGIQGAVPGGAMAKAQRAFHHDDLEHFLAGLHALGDVLARHVPHTEGSDATDLPNAPRIRP